MAKTGRKGFGEELELLRRYSDLSEGYFNFLKQMLEGEDKADKKWAVDCISKAYVKMIPQKIAGDEENPINFGIIMYPNGKDNVETPQGATGESSS